jgi:hypothetical protein
VQTELVDHLANGIETQLEENPNLTFESALNSEFKKFGIMGFSEVIEEKTKALNSHYRILVWKYFKAFFKLPKILITLVLIWLIYFTLESIDSRLWVVIPFVTLLSTVSIGFLYVQSKKVKNLKKATGKKWLFDNVALQLGGLVYGISIVMQVLSFPNVTWNAMVNFIFASIIVLFGLAIYISVFIVSPKLRKQMAKQHPEYKFV